MPVLHGCYADPAVLFPAQHGIIPLTVEEKSMYTYNPFFTGDEVQCVDADESDGRLEFGAVYEVLAVDGRMLDLGHDFMWEIDRFVPAEVDA